MARVGSPREAARRATVATGLLLVGALGACSSPHSTPTAPLPTPVSTGASVTAAVPSTTASTLAGRPSDPGVAVPTVTGPISGGQPDVPVDAMPTSYTTQYGYTEREYLISGTAHAYQPTGRLGSDGAWTVGAGAGAPYETRIIVRAPTDPARFNGTVVVEWLNAVSGQDADLIFGAAGPELLRDGYAYVGVSAQQDGVTGAAGPTSPAPGPAPKPLVTQNPARYAGLKHPGDDYAYDIFSQAAQAILQPGGPLGQLHPRHVLATGDSDAADHLMTYIDAVEPLTRMFDGFLLQSRSRVSAPLVGTQPVSDLRVRTDLVEPVMLLSTEGDLFSVLIDSYTTRQPDTDGIRTWESAGTAHAEESDFAYRAESQQIWDPGSAPTDQTKLCGSINDGPQRYITRAAVAALNTWVTSGTAAPQAPALDVEGGKIARDANGNANGGIRTPAVDVPIETVSGDPPPGFTLTQSTFVCALSGSRGAFSPAQLTRLYPSHAAYVAKVAASADAAVKAGFLLPPDAQEIEQVAAAAPVPTA